MIIGIPKEIKDQEYRVAATPSIVNDFVSNGHQVLIEKGAGAIAGFEDAFYEKAGAVISTTEEVWNNSDMIYKVKEPLASEYKYLREGQILFTYLHLAADKELTQALVDRKVTAIGYETVENGGHRLPLLAPMSEIAGRIAVQDGADLLTTTKGGKGILLQGLPGVAPAHVVVVGCGIAGTGAIRTAIGIGARVTALDINVERLSRLQDVFGHRLETLYSNEYNLQQAIKHADLVIGAVLIPGAKAPKVITEKMVKSMQKGGVIFDIAIDQGSCVETIDHSTSHANPTYVKHGIIHYAVANIPGKVPQSATQGLSNVTSRYALSIANYGIEEAFKKDIGFEKGLNTYKGHVTHKEVAKAHDMEYTPLQQLI